MIRLPRAAVFCAVGPLLAGCRPAQGPHPMTAAHAAAIQDSVQAVLDAFTRYSAAGQWDSLGTLYDDGGDFRWMEQGIVQYRSAAQIREALTRVARGTRIETTYHDTQIVPLGPGAASVATAFHTRFVDSANPQAVEFGGVTTMTLAHREAGWRIVAGHTSSRAGSDR